MYAGKFSGRLSGRCLGWKKPSQNIAHWFVLSRTRAGPQPVHPSLCWQGEGWRVLLLQQGLGGWEVTPADISALGFLSANQGLSTSRAGDKDTDRAAVISRSQQFLGRRQGSPPSQLGGQTWLTQGGERGRPGTPRRARHHAAHVGATAVQPPRLVRQPHGKANTTAPTHPVSKSLCP